MMYFFLLSSLRKENYAAVGIDKECDYLKDEEKMDVIANLTAKTKAIIRRDFLIANFKDAFRNNGSAALLLDFAKNICPKNWQTLQTSTMKCTRNAIYVWKKGKLLCWSRQKKPNSLNPKKFRNKPQKNSNPKWLPKQVARVEQSTHYLLSLTQTTI